MKEFEQGIESRALKLALKTLLAMTLVVARVQAFSLLGQYADWMQTTNGFRQAGDIGGPMDLDKEYRWNVPVLTYAFDSSFLDYFGSNGVAAVEQAIQIFNELPAASSIVPSSYPLESKEVNFAAQANHLYDLKSAALYLIIEQLGLGQPTRNIYVLRRWNSTFVQFPSEPQWYPELFPDFLLEQNFDPETLAATHYVNGTLFYGLVYSSGNPNPAPLQADVLELVADPFAPVYTAIADRTVSSGELFKGLTRDDAGGLRYLLDATNTNFEILLPGVHGIGTNAGSYVNQAVRPGIEKITFVRPAYDSLLGRFFVPFTNQFADRYITNSTVVEQQVERVVQEPDFIFTSGDTSRPGFGATLVARTSTSNWWNSGAPGMAGPGLIRPPIRITFGRWSVVRTDDSWPEGEAVVENLRWGSFDNSTNPPVTYPLGFLPSNDMTVHLLLYEGSSVGGPFMWQLPVLSGQPVMLQTSTNLVSWVTLTTLTNQGTPVWWYHHRSQSQRFFRVVPL